MKVWRVTRSKDLYQKILNYIFHKYTNLNPVLNRISILPWLIVIISAVILTARISFIIFGIYDVEVESAIIPGLQHPWEQSWQAPYGLGWYILNIPLTFLQVPGLDPAQSWLLCLAVIDAMFMWIIRRNRLLAIFYIVISLLTFRQAPYNMTILWIILAGLYWPPSLLLAPLAKFPVGAPLEIWEYIFSNSMQASTNWRYYALMMVLWFMVFHQVRNYFFLSRTRRYLSNLMRR